MKFDELVRQRQANSTSLVSTAARILNAMKTIEQARKLPRRNSDSSIADCQFHRIARMVQANGDFPLKCKFESVGD